MAVMINILGRAVPSYGLMIALGFVVGNIAAFFSCKKWNLNFDNFLLYECFAAFGIMIGGKALFLITNASAIEWSRFFEKEYFTLIMESGFVFFGSLIGGAITLWLGAKWVVKENPLPFLRRVIFVVPLIHAFGRIGCFLAGCCYGKEYHGIGHVVFPENSFAPSGIELYPTQLMESACLFLIAFILYQRCKKEDPYTILEYGILYCFVRFGLEFFRGDLIRGFLGPFSTSQWISLGIVVFLIIVYNISKSKSLKEINE